MSSKIFAYAAEGIGASTQYQGSQEPRFCPFCCQKQGGELNFPVFLAKMGVHFQCPNCSRRFDPSGALVEEKSSAGQIGW